MWIPSSSRFPVASLLPFPPPSLGRSLLLYISFSFVHPPPTLVSHPCPYLSARPISHSFWCSVSCCGPHRIVQGSRPHKWVQGISCWYLIRMWQLLLGLLFYHALMANPLGSKSLLGSSRGLLLVIWCLPLLWFWSAEDRVILGSISWQSGFPLFVFGHFFLLGMGLGLDMKWARVPRSFGPTIAPQNHAARLLGREEDFDVLGPISWPVESCSPMGARAPSPTQGTLLAFWRTRCIVINSFMGCRGSLWYIECIFNDAFIDRKSVV